jgi:PAS domain S-box-containing protein
MGERAGAMGTVTPGELPHVVEHALDGVFIADLEGRYIDVNAAGCRMLGYSREELIGKTIGELIPPEDVDRLAHARLELLEVGGQVAEWKLRRKDGSYVPVEVAATMSFGARPTGQWHAFVRDITDRKQFADDLRASEARSAGILSISADAIISIDETHCITMFNRGAEQIFGYAKAEVVGRPLEILLPERYRAGHRRHLQGFGASHDAVGRRMGERRAAIVGLRKTGQEFPADAAISRLEVGGKTILTVALRDVTEQQRSENEQRFLAEVGAAVASTLEFDETLTTIARLAVRDLADLCYVNVVDESGETRPLKVLVRDPAKAWVCDVLMGMGLPLPTTPLQWTLGTQRPVLLSWVSPELVSAWAHDPEHLRALQAIGIESMITVPLLAHGNLVGSMALASCGRAYEVADVRLAEELAQRAALSILNAQLYRQAQRALASRDAVLALVAHDLRGPLGAILMQSSVLQLRGPEATDGAAKAIERAVRRMSRLIDDLLDITRIEAGHLSTEKTRVPAPALIDQLVEDHRAQVLAASLVLDVELAAELPDVWADRDRLLQVIENLVGNALKFTQPGGRITIRAERGAGDVVFSVADTGAGLAAGELPRLFDRFWQAQRSGRRGAGLGLPIVKGIVDAHGGRIWVDSKPGRGSTFYFTIPTVPDVT